MFDTINNAPPQEPKKKFNFVELPNSWYNVQIEGLEKVASKSSSFMLGVLKLKIIDNDNFSMTIKDNFNFDNDKPLKNPSDQFNLVRDYAFNTFCNFFLPKIDMSIDIDKMKDQLMVGSNMEKFSRMIEGKSLSIFTELGEPWGEHNRRFPKVKMYGYYNEKNIVKKEEEASDFLDTITEAPPEFKDQDQLPF